MKREREFFIKNRKKVNYICKKILDDDKSRKTYQAVIEYRTIRKHFLRRIALKCEEQYFPLELFNLEKESFVDCGAYIGDTIESFFKHGGADYEAIYAFEPSQENYNKLSKYVKGLDNVFLFQMGISNSEGIAYFSQDSYTVNPSAKISKGGGSESTNYYVRSCIKR